MSNALERRLEGELEQFIRDGVYKRLNFLDSPQGPRVRMEGRGEVMILSSNNYLGLVQSGRGGGGRPGQRSTRYGAGTASSDSSAERSRFTASWKPPARDWSAPRPRSAS